MIIYRYKISIHALREESDLDYGPNGRLVDYISIHALREESDSYQNPYFV